TEEFKVEVGLHQGSALRETENKLVACFLKRQSMHVIQASFYARNRLFSARKCCF
ncbi:hypothetical protein Q5P01_000707, partial [Channa striata]